MIYPRDDGGIKDSKEEKDEGEEIVQRTIRLEEVERESARDRPKGVSAPSTTVEAKFIEN